MKKIFLGIFVASLSIISCKKDEKPTYIKDDVAATNNTTVSSTPKTSIIDQAGIKTVQSSPVINSTTVPNPAHGQPGHRCDVAVGEPIPIQAQQVGNNQNIQVAQNQPVVINPGQMKTTATTTAPQPVKTAPGMNPPHGEPGHRCDIAVGAPLNSKPTETQPTENTPQVVPTTTTTPEQKVASNGQKPKVNPPHGEPFHDCAKQVGDPL